MNNVLIRDRLQAATDVLLVSHSEPMQAANADTWMRVAGIDGLMPIVWYDGKKQYDLIVLPLPKGKAALELCLACLAPQLAAGGELLLHGQNDEGIKSADKILRTYFRTVETASIADKGRVYSACDTIAQPKTLEDFASTQTLSLNGQAVDFKTYPGLFAKGRLDAATALLLENLPDIPISAHVLDYACGLGVIGCAVQLRQPQSKILLVDYDPLAIHAAQQNVPAAATQCTAAPEAIAGSFDLIFSNPPIHLGQRLDYGIVERLVARLPDILSPQGSAYVVTQVTVPVARYAAESKLAATQIAASSSFRVTKIVR